MICSYSVLGEYDADEQVDQKWDMNLLQGHGIPDRSLIILVCMSMTIAQFQGKVYT